MGGEGVAIVHDYLTQRGGAERVVLSMLDAYPGAAVYTSVYDPGATFPEFREVRVRPMPWLNRIPALRSNHRLGLPVYGMAFRNLVVEAETVICSSSGWSHHVSTTAPKIVYCHAPARWLYQQEAYARFRPPSYRLAIATFGESLRANDRAGAATASRYLTNSRAVRQQIAELYNLDATVIAPPPALSDDGPVRPLSIQPGYLLVISRLLPYKNVDVAIRAALECDRRLVVVGDGPDRHRLEAMAGGRVDFLGTVEDAELRWLYANCSALLALSYEDFGIATIEANSFGAPVIALRWGGFLDTVVDGKTGVFCETLDLGAVASAFERLDEISWDTDKLRSHAALFSKQRFLEKLTQAVEATRSAARQAVAS